MLASLNRNEETGIKKSFLSIPKFLSSNIEVFIILFCFVNSLLKVYACSEWSFFSWWQRECLSEIQHLPDSTGSFGLVQIKKRDRVKNESFRKERCEVSSGWQPCFEVRLSAEGWVCLGRDVLQLFVWIKGPWASNAWETQEENIRCNGTARGRKVLEYCPLDINQYSPSSILPDILRIKWGENLLWEYNDAVA